MLCRMAPNSSSLMGFLAAHTDCAESDAIGTLSHRAVIYVTRRSDGAAACGPAAILALSGVLGVPQKFVNGLKYHAGGLPLLQEGIHVNPGILRNFRSPGKHHNEHLRLNLLHGGCHLASIHLRHGVIEQDQVYGMGGE